MFTQVLHTSISLLVCSRSATYDVPCTHITAISTKGYACVFGSETVCVMTYDVADCLSGPSSVCGLKKHWKKEVLNLL